MSGAAVALCVALWFFAGLAFGVFFHTQAVCGGSAGLVALR